MHTRLHRQMMPDICGLDQQDRLRDRRERLRLIERIILDVDKMRHNGTLDAAACDAVLRSVTANFVEREIAERIECTLGSAFEKVIPRRAFW